METDMWIASAVRQEETKSIVEEIPAPPIKYLVFEGGGIRGLAFRDAILELKYAGVLEEIVHVAGSSIGAIAAMLLALGYASQDHEVKNLLGNLSFKSFLEGQKPWYLTPELIIRSKQYLAILTNDGHSLSSGKLLQHWLEQRVYYALGNTNATFNDLARYIETQPKSPFKYLSVTGSNLTKNRLDVFNHETTPDMPIALAVRISAAFPGVFKPIEWHDGQDICLYMDGGVINNLPYFIFHDEKYLHGYAFTKKGANPLVLNIKVDTAEEIANVLWQNNSVKKIIRSFKEYSKAVLDGMQSRDRDIYEQYSTNTIQIYDQDIDTLLFEINTNLKEKLFYAGHEATSNWLENHVDEAYHVNIYEDERHWLASKTIEQVAEIRQAYLKQAALETENPIERNNLIEKFHWLKDYLFWRTHQLIGAHYPIQFSEHINLKANPPRKKIDSMIKVRMLKRLEIIQNKINLLVQKIAIGKGNLHTFNEWHDPLIYEQVAFVVYQEENLKILKNMKNDLLLKLNQPTDNDDSQTLSDRYVATFNQMQTMFNNCCNNHQANVLPFSSVMLQIKNHLANHAYEYRCDDQVIILDLSKAHDFLLYFLAVTLYLKFLNVTTPLVHEIYRLYQSLFNRQNFPKHLADIGLILEKQQPEALLAAYRIENIVNELSRSTLNQEKVLDLQEILAVCQKPNQKPTHTLWKNNLQTDIYGIEMSPLRNWMKIDRLKLFQSNDYQSNQFMHSQTEGDHKTPKCLRKL